MKRSCQSCVAVCLPFISHSFPMLILTQTYQPPWCFSNAPDAPPPQGLCTCYSPPRILFPSVSLCGFLICLFFTEPFLEYPFLKWQLLYSLLPVPASTTLTSLTFITFIFSSFPLEYKLQEGKNFTYFVSGFLAPTTVPEAYMDPINICGMDAKNQKSRCSKTSKLIII